MHELNVDPKILCLLKVAMYQHEGDFILLHIKVILNLSWCFPEKSLFFAFVRFQWKAILKSYKITLLMI